MQLHQTSIVRFRQDLRVHDNTALILACTRSESVIPVFIFETVILDQSPAQDPRVGFLIDAVKQLDAQLRARGSQLYVLHGDSTQLIPQLIQEHGAQALYVNRSYGRGSMTRDMQIADSCRDQGVVMELCDDYLLVEPGAIPQRKVFSPYYKLRQLQPKRTPESAPAHIITPDLPLTHREDIVDQLDAGPNLYRPIDYASQALQDFDLSQYVAKRNRVDVDGTSRLSPYTRFGIVSIRQVYQVMLTHSDGLTNKYIAELARREFWQHIMHYFPETVDIEFQERKRNIPRINDESQFQARCEGRTGYPMIDAAMIQLTTKNRMHGRARMLVASFLTKHLLIDWRRGEQHFARYLIDYDRNINIGNRQRSASVGADPKPLRIFSPIIQAQKFDPKAIYIKHYLPQLANISAKTLHDPITHDVSGYPMPMVDHITAYRRAREVYRQSYDALNE